MYPRLPPEFPTRGFLRDRKSTPSVAAKRKGTAPFGGGGAAASPPRGQQLLHAMRGGVPRGALCALMGPSGSGKSTLLDLLTGRRSLGRCEGELLFEGRSVADQQARVLT